MKRLYRSRSDRKMAGIAAGIAEYFNIDPTLVRLLFVAGFFLTSGMLLLIYFIAMFIIPDEWEVK